MSAPVKDYSHLLKDKKITVSNAADQSLSEALRKGVASAYVLATLAKLAHWNIECCTFFPLHEAFDDLNKLGRTASDDLAERLRQLKEYVQVDLAAFQSQAGITFPTAPQDAKDWLNAVLAGIEKVNGDLVAVKKAAAAVNDRDTEDIGIEHGRALSKLSWMLRSSLPE